VALFEDTTALHRADLQAEVAAASDDVRLGVEVTAGAKRDEGKGR
jgi:hypothetical protein